MKITVGGSMIFAKEQVEVKKLLEQRGHEVLLTENIEDYVKLPEIKQNIKKEIQISLDYDIMKNFFKKIEESDAFLICNYPKNGIKGYLGTSVLMEIGVAHHISKRIYLLYDIDKSQNYAVEVSLINPIVLNGNLNVVRD